MKTWILIILVHGSGDALATIPNFFDETLCMMAKAKVESALHTFTHNVRAVCVPNVIRVEVVK